MPRAGPLVPPLMIGGLFGAESDLIDRIATPLGSAGGILPVQVAVESRVGLGIGATPSIAAVIAVAAVVIVAAVAPRVSAVLWRIVRVAATPAPTRRHVSARPSVVSPEDVVEPAAPPVIDTSVVYPPVVDSPVLYPSVLYPSVLGALGRRGTARAELEGGPLPLHLFALLSVLRLALRLSVALRECGGNGYDGERGDGNRHAKMFCC